MGTGNSKEIKKEQDLLKKQKERKKVEINYEKYQRKSSLILKLPKGYAIDQCKTFDANQVFKPNRPNTHTFENVGVPRYSNKGISKEEDKNEYFDELSLLQEKIKELALMITTAATTTNIDGSEEQKQKKPYVVVYTGAGISTSADLPDFRGPNGAWTREEPDYKSNSNSDHGKRIPTLTEIVPTFAHMAIAKLVELDLVQMVITTNMDNLHRRAGVPDHKIIELHGNSFKERCTICKKDYYRDIEIYEGETLKCEVESCNGTLIDTIVNFNEPIHQKDWDDAKRHSESSTLSLVVGTSLRVLPSCILPEMAIMKRNKKESTKNNETTTTTTTTTTTSTTIPTECDTTTASADTTPTPTTTTTTTTTTDSNITNNNNENHEEIIVDITHDNQSTPIVSTTTPPTTTTTSTTIPTECDTTTASADTTPTTTTTTTTTDSNIENSDNDNNNNNNNNSNNEANMVICNFQITPYDDSSKPRFFCPSDDLFYYLMKELNIEVSTITPKGESIKPLAFPTKPKPHHIDSKKLDPSSYNVNFRFLF